MPKDVLNYMQENDIPSTISIVPTIDIVVFPHMVVPLLILDEKIIKGLDLALQSHKKVLLLAAQQHNNDYQSPIGVNDLYKMGTVGNIMRIMHLPEGGSKILIQGLCKAHVDEVYSDQDKLYALIRAIDPETSKKCDNTVLETRIKSLFMLIERMANSGKIFSPDFQSILAQIHDSERIADFVLSHLNITIPQAQMLLERETIADLIEGIYDFLQHEYELNSVQEKIKSNTRESINRSQREYYLREQLKSIQKELGDEVDNEVDELKQKIINVEAFPEAKVEAQRQLRRLEKTPPDSMEATVIRHYLDWLLNMPWGVFTKENANIQHAKDILNKNHHGLDDVKERILDFLSVRFLKQDCQTPILCFFGPPGVGKTSLGQSIADCLNRKFFRISLGGVYDESEIRGHRRTYVGAMPGRFIQAIKKSGSCNPVIIIDEIDKIGLSNRGDPSAALLEVLDPEQNSAFYDNYLGVHFDLSKCMFIATANDLSTIPAPLRDRLEIIQLSGYTHEEKIEIAKNHLIPKAVKNNGLLNHGITITQAVLEKLISSYTREAGVRELSRYIQKLCSKYVRALVETKTELTFSTDTLAEFLGPTKIHKETSSLNNKIGVTNGLAWTQFGGEVLQVEAVLMPGSGKLLMTGQLGDIMKESAQAAMTYAKSHADVFGIARSMFLDYDLHIHLPAGAIPKDGPSAGITLLSSILSSYTKRAIAGDFAMTGELNLQGDVLPIGGIKEKILAAKQHGLLNIILPKSNQKDLIGMDKLFHGLRILFVENVNEVLQHVLLP